MWPLWAIMGHIPPCMQQPQLHADLHDAGVPLTSSGTFREPHRPKATNSVQTNPLITMVLV
jgi:hypothetical protein